MHGSFVLSQSLKSGCQDGKHLVVTSLDGCDLYILLLWYSSVCSSLVHKLSLKDNVSAVVNLSTLSITSSGKGFVLCEAPSLVLTQFLSTLPKHFRTSSVPLILVSEETETSYTTPRFSASLDDHTISTTPTYQQTSNPRAISTLHTGPYLATAFSKHTQSERSYLAPQRCQLWFQRSPSSH